MPNKIEAENQFLRLLANSPLQINIQLLRIDNHKSKNTPAEHINKFYDNFDDIKDDYFSGLLVTGAPLGLLNFSEVLFWPEINRILRWAKKHVTSILFICWAVQAALNIFYKIPKKTRKFKLSGIYQHHTMNQNALLTRGFDPTFLAPHSRYADFPTDIIRQHTDLEILVESNEVGAYLFTSPDKQLVFVTGHPEYDLLTLANEYHRDCKKGLNPTIPVNYFPKNNPSLIPNISWNSHSYLLFSNWINYFIARKEISLKITS